MRRYSYYVFPQNGLPEVPKIGQRVTIEGQLGAYIVLYINRKRASADLMLASGNHEVEQGVPFGAIQPAPDPQGVEAKSEKDSSAVPSSERP